MSPPADQSVADPALSRWMYETLKHGEWRQARRPAEATPAPTANLDMVRLTEDEVPMVVQALWTQPDAPRKAHNEKRLWYSDWKQTAAQIERLRGIEAFHRQHDAALYDAKHAEHTSRTAELQAKYDEAYADESVAP